MKREELEQQIRDFQKKAGDEVKVCEATGGVAHLVQLLDRAPKPLAQLIEHQLEGFLLQLHTRLVQLVAEGPALPVAKAQSVYEVVDEAFENMPKDLPGMPGIAMQKHGKDIAKAIDSAISNMAITAQNEDYINHSAWLDVVEGHATVIAGINGLYEVPADYSDEKFEAKIAEHKAQAN